jgi:hypothetical protein
MWSPHHQAHSPLLRNLAACANPQRMHFPKVAACLTCERARRCFHTHADSSLFFSGCSL